MINQNTPDPDFDIVIVGGGPAGSTCSTLLKKYRPDLSVLVLEKEQFPRDHIGESQLPSIGPILQEMGCWDKVEKANFPIKVGASYTWGKSMDRWDFDFVPVERFVEEERPAKFEGQRTLTAFQVDRAVYDDLLLRHAESVGVEVREQTTVTRVLVEDGGDCKRITGLELDTGETVTGKYYIDGSGAIGLLRRALGVESEAPKALRNIAVWDYWENADWAVEIGVGGTRVQVRSLSFGWIWFIPMGPTKTSIGLICPADYIKQTGAKPANLYMQAVREQEDIAKLIEGATPRGEVETCRDWSHLSSRVCGENWFLTGEASGFADPILAAGMALAHNSAREAAYTILELERGELEHDWLMGRYDTRNRTNIEQHIRFAQFWYAANGCFGDLQENCSAIAAEAGLELKPADAWRWLSQGGFTTESVGSAQFGSFDVASAKQVVELFSGEPQENKIGWKLNDVNVLKLNIEGAKKDWIGKLKDGKIQRVLCYVRGEHKLPRSGYYLDLINMLQQHSEIATLVGLFQQRTAHHPPQTRSVLISIYYQTLDTMLAEGWVKGRLDPKLPRLTLSTDGSHHIRLSTETDEAIAQAGREDIIKTNM